jgi:predicted house-cleaning noncanonical NTP pyrophosphatase (MazG superfamily)
MAQKDGFLYHNGRQLLRIPVATNSEFDKKKVDKLWEKIKEKVCGGLDDGADIMEINGDKYVEQMMINMILIEKIKQLEAAMTKIRS